MPNDLDLRASKLVWYLRLCQFIGASIVLGLTAPAIVSWHGVQCSAPGQLIYNVVCAAITLPPVLYLIVSTGPAHKWPLPWSRMFQFFIDISFLSLWIAAISDSTYNCSELCGTCGGSSDGAQGAGFSFSVIYPALTCACSGGTGLHPHGAGIVGEKGPNVAAKQAFDSIMMLVPPHSTVSSRGE
ncbi:MAG: hypothetical protein M1838_003070 [Thelocarpon superellum]|nr:MAG: hypothetical protein M1838_003070 [Thelocarpon superellum]